MKRSLLLILTAHSLMSFGCSRSDPPATMPRPPAGGVGAPAGPQQPVAANPPAADPFAEGADPIGTGTTNGDGRVVTTLEPGEDPFMPTDPPAPVAGEDDPSVSFDDAANSVGRVLGRAFSQTSEPSSDDEPSGSIFGAVGRALTKGLTRAAEPSEVGGEQPVATEQTGTDEPPED